MLENVVKNIQNASTIENTKEKFLCEKFVPICEIEKEHDIDLLKIVKDNAKKLQIKHFKYKITLKIAF